MLAKAGDGDADFAEHAELEGDRGHAIATTSLGVTVCSCSGIGVTDGVGLIDIDTSLYASVAPILSGVPLAAR